MLGPVRADEPRAEAVVEVTAKGGVLARDPVDGPPNLIRDCLASALGGISERSRATMHSVRGAERLRNRLDLVLGTLGAADVVRGRRVGELVTKFGEPSFVLG